MTDPYGIPDLAALRHPAPSEPVGTPAEHEVAVTEQSLEQIIQDSQQVATVLLVTSGRVPEAEAFLGSLRAAVDAKGGAVRLATVDADSQPRVAEALRVRQLPTLLLLLGGQLQPIVESVLPEAEVTALIDQVVQVAQQQGMDVSAAGETADPEPEPVAPLVQAAYDAIDRGDLDAAVTAYEEQLRQSPADAEARAGLATVELMRRTRDADLNAARAAAAEDRTDLDAQLLVADLDMLGGHVEDAFARLLDLLRGADPETKDVLRTRLLELFEVAGSEDPRVPPARKRLANLLF
ncbi:co-chaperone YbbN [Brachybacterium hainanense]|uniref:Co-chaperone YbbN n=1 Tax=Brachybacterium hainanense TaxID=1541174 RepID=A0ABV6R8T5_9MICO